MRERIRLLLRREEKDRERGMVPGQQEGLLRVKGAMERKVGQHGWVFPSDHVQLLGTGMEKAEGAV